MNDTRTFIEPAPTPEEAAAIVAALGAVREPEPGPPVRSRWRLAGLLGRPVPPGMELDGSLWSYSGWRDVS